MATATERKFTGLRKRLDQLGYRQSLGIESLPLVDKLFGDLLHTTESLKNAKQQLGKHREEKSVWEQHVEPFQADNARVIKENNELHQQLMKIKENSDQRAREFKAVLRRLEHENADLKFLNTQYLQRLRTQEKESEKKTEKILELQEKNFQAVIHTPGGKKKSIPFRRQRMEIDCALPDSTKTDATTLVVNLPPPDPYVADLLQVADQRMAQLQSMVEQLKGEKVKVQDTLQSMRKLVENRENEIHRLTQMLKGGRPAEALAAEGIRQSRERMVAHLNIQVDFLQKASHELEEKLAESERSKAELEERVKELSAKNARICSELQEIGELVKQTEEERGLSEEQFNLRIRELEEEKSKVLETHEEVRQGLKVLESERAELLEDNQRMANLLADSKGDRKEVADVLDRLAEERKNFQRQCKQFKDKEATLQRHIADLESLRVPPPQAPTTTLPAEEVRWLKKERDDLKDAVSSFEAQLLDIQMDTKILAEDRDNFKLLYQQVNEELSRSKMQFRRPSAPGAAVLRRVEGERDHVLLELQKKKTECRSLQDRLKTLQDTQQHDLKALEDRQAEMGVQLEEMRIERDEVSGRLASTKQMLSSMETELEQSTQALSAANTDLMQQRAKVSQLQALVEASERTRHEQQRGIRTQEADVKASQATVTSLNRKIVQLTHDVNQREEKLSELQHALTMLDQERDQLVNEADIKDEAVAELRSQLQHKDTSLKEAELRLGKLQARLGQAEGSHREREMEVSEVNNELNSTKMELINTKEQVNSLTMQVGQLRSDLQTMTKENQSIHSELRSVAGEKDSLSLKVREYAQSLLQYEEAMALKEQEKGELMDSYEAMKRDTEEMAITLRELQGTLTTTKTEVLAISKEKQEAEVVMEQQAREISALRAYEEQLSHMTHALSKMEGALRQEQEEKKALIDDLETTRELCVQLDRSKESLSSHLSTQTMQYEQLHSQIGDIKAERDLLKAQLGSERSSSEQLHSLISIERQKEFQAHAVGREKEEEILQLRQLLAKLEADRVSLADQTRKLRADTAMQSQSLQRLQSDLISEKYEKQHLKHQLDAQRASLTMLTAPKLHADVRSPSPLRGGQPHSSPALNLPEEPALSSPQSTPSLQLDSRRDSQAEENLFSREKETFGDSSSKVVEKLLNESISSSSTIYNSPDRTSPSP